MGKLEEGTVLALKWLDDGPSKDTVDLVPRHWFAHEINANFKQHTVLDQSGANCGKVRCTVKVEATTVELDYAGEHALFNEERGFIVGCTRLTFAGPRRLGLPNVAWRADGEAEFSGRWKVDLTERVLQAKDFDRFRPKGLEEGQRELFRKVAVRQGQSAFRDRLMVAYGGRCAVTGCTVEEVLQAAHIEPYSQGRNSSTSNGILLRADIHSLFDLGIVRIRGDYAIDAPDSVRCALSLPKKLLIVPDRPAHRPCPDGLERKWLVIDQVFPD